ncbi:hypothetical protein [Winogradskyella sp.]|uniref:hypothetical protein n=1 Tax=Winogradskyella sp. TaxID=1883156 RepID=UPI002629E33B|nr:hypothetical protein [Winogradskyella sp.]
MDDIIWRYSNNNFRTKTIGYGRSFLAASTLISIIFNDFDLIFIEKKFLLNLFDFSDNHLITKTTAVLILILVIIGIVPRMTAILHFWVSLSFYQKILYTEGGDQITVIITFLLIPILLFDNRIWHWNNIDDSSTKTGFHNSFVNVFNSFIFLSIRLQIAIVYFISSVSKPYKVEQWKDGTALYYWFNDAYYGYSGAIKTLVSPLINEPLFLLILTWGTLILELIIACCLFLSYSVRRYVFVLGVFLHISIFLIHGLATFSLTMIGALILLMGSREKTFGRK